MGYILYKHLDSFADEKTGFSELRKGNISPTLTRLGIRWNSTIVLIWWVQYKAAPRSRGGGSLHFWAGDRQMGTCMCRCTHMRVCAHTYTHSCSALCSSASHMIHGLLCLSFKGLEQITSKILWIYTGCLDHRKAAFEGEKIELSCPPFQILYS